MNQKPIVISIAAVSGGGKTTITKQLMSEFPNAKALYFDDYSFNECPDDICTWIKAGANYEEWVLTPFISDVQALLHHSPTLDYLFLDYPFAYLHDEMKKYIDLAIYIDTPLDIAMARRIRRDFTNCSIEDIHDHLLHYLTYGRTAYFESIHSVKSSSDIVVDGSLNPSCITKQLVEEIKNRKRAKIL
jgi:uridine kinase